MNHSLDSIGVDVEGERKMKISKVRKNEESSKDLNSFFTFFLTCNHCLYFITIYVNHSYILFPY